MGFGMLGHLLNLTEEVKKAFNSPTNVCVREAKAMASTPADIKEYPNSYTFVLDMPGLKPGDIQVQLEDNNVLVVSGERMRKDEKEGKNMRTERRVGKFMRKFSLPENADTEGISTACKDGVLTVTVKKMTPPEPKKPKTVKVQVA